MRIKFALFMPLWLSPLARPAPRLRRRRPRLRPTPACMPLRWSGNTGAAQAAAGNAALLDARDSHGRTALHVATYYRQHDVMRALAKAGADANALDSQKYDIVTIAAVADDAPTLLVALEIGCSPATSQARGMARR